VNDFNYKAVVVTFRIREAVFGEIID